MAIKVNNTTVISDDRNISSVGIATVGIGSTAITLDGSNSTVNVGTGVSINGSTGNVSIAGTLTASGFTVPTNITVYSPAIGSTNVSATTNISFTFDQVVGVGTTFGSTGSIELRSGSPSGSIIQSFTPSQVTKDSNFQITLDPTNPLPGNTEIFPVIPKGFVKSLQFFEYDGNIIESSINFVGLNTTGAESYSFTTENVLVVESYTPSNGATNVSVNSDITLTFNGTPSRGTGTITLRSGSASGNIIASFDAATSDRISISENNWILDLNPDLESIALTTIYLVIPNTAISPYGGLNIGGGTDSYSFTTGNPEVGNSYGGGFLICQSGGVRWIVAPMSSEVSRNWYTKNDAITTAQQVSGCTGWFIPPCTQLTNPMYICRNFWDCYSLTWYNSSTAVNNDTSWAINMSNGTVSCGGRYGGGFYKNVNICTRAFRCVTY